MCNITYYIFISTYFFISKMPVLPKKVCNVSYHVPKEGKNGAIRGQNGHGLAKSTGKVRGQREGKACGCMCLARIGLAWLALGSRMSLQMSLRPRSIGGGWAEEEGRAREGKAARPRHGQGTQCTYTYTYVHIHMHTYAYII